MQDSRDVGNRFFLEDDQVFHANGKTYALSNQWGSDTLEVANSLKNGFSDLNIEIKPSES